MTIELIFLGALTLSQVLVLCGALSAMYMVWHYIRLNYTVMLFVDRRLTVNCDDLLPTFLAEPPVDSVQCPAKMRRLLWN